MTEFGVPEEHIFSSRDLTFVKGIMRVTNNRGVDVVLNSLSGEVCRVCTVVNPSTVNIINRRYGFRLFEAHGTSSHLLVDLSR